jgi:hypothetical protein
MHLDAVGEVSDPVGVEKTLVHGGPYCPALVPIPIPIAIAIATSTGTSNTNTNTNTASTSTVANLATIVITITFLAITTIFSFVATTHGSITIITTPYNLFCYSPLCVTTTTTVILSPTPRSVTPLCMNVRLTHNLWHILDAQRTTRHILAAQRNTPLFRRVAICRLILTIIRKVLDFAQLHVESKSRRRLA